MTGIFQDDRDHNFRISVRSVADEEGMVPESGRHTLRFARLFILREPDHLGGARLPADVLFLSFQDIPRSPLFIDHPPQRSVDDLDVFGADRQDALFLRLEYLYDMSVQRFKLFYEPGPVKGAAVGQGRIGVGELDRGHEIEPLTDGEGDGFTHLPGFPEAGKLPLFRRDQTALLPGEVDPQRGAEAEGSCVGGDPVYAEQFPQVVEIDVAGLHDGAVEIDISVTLRLPAAEDPVA